LATEPLEELPNMATEPLDEGVLRDYVDDDPAVIDDEWAAAVQEAEAQAAAERAAAQVHGGLRVGVQTLPAPALPAMVPNTAPVMSATVPDTAPVLPVKVPQMADFDDDDDVLEDLPAESCAAVSGESAVSGERAVSGPA
jgi:hypothetical protein